MITLRRAKWVFLLASTAAPSFASELSYTFVDFQVIANTVEAAGTQTPVPAQTVAILTDEGDGISIGGSVLIGTRFFLAGEISNIDHRRLRSHHQPPGHDGGNGQFRPDSKSHRVRLPERAERELRYRLRAFVRFVGVRFRQLRRGELRHAQHGRRSERRLPVESARAVRALRSRACQPVGKGNLQTLEFESETRMRLGAVWYFLEDLGVGLDYEAGDVDTVSLSMRFSFGDLSLQRSRTDISQDR